jgi:hypothetical protein
MGDVEWEEKGERVRVGAGGGSGRGVAGRVRI